MHRILTALTMILLCGTATAQSFWDAVPSNMKDRKSFRRLEWFYRQRALPYDTIPMDVWRRELRQAVLKEKDSRAAGLSWTPLGPSGIVWTIPAQWGTVSGRVRALAVHPSDPQTIYIGAASGGLWKSTDGGSTWMDVGFELSSQTYGAIAIDPTNPEIVYAGAGEAIRFFNLIIYGGDGLYKSTDGGASWTNITDGFGSRTHWSALKVSPTNSANLYAALASGNWLSPAPTNEGVWRSTDGGFHWTRTLNVNDAFDVLPHPTNPDKVFAAVGGASAAAGFYISTNGGETWEQSNTGLPSPFTMDRLQMAMTPTDSSTIYALINASGTQTMQLYKSTNGGMSWFQKVGYSDPQGWYDLMVAVNPNDVDEVYIGNTELRRSTNGGTSFSYVGGSGFNQAMHLDFHYMMFAPSDPSVRYVGCDGGVYRSTNGGVSWQHRNTGLPITQYYRMASHPGNPDIVLGGSQDNGLYMTTNGVAGPWNLVTIGDGMESFFDRVDPNTVYVSIQNARLYKSLTGGFFNSYFEITPNFSGETRAWTAPFFQHPTDTDILYTASTRPYKSTNAGASWFPMAAAFSSTAINSMDQCHVQPNNMIAVSGEYSTSPTVRISTDGGTGWYVTSVPGLVRFISRVVAHPTDASTMFVVRSGFGSGKLYRSTNLGTSWENLSGDLPDVPASDFFVDPRNPHHWYLANDLGVYFSSNGGTTWTRGNGMPFVPAVDFSYFDDGVTRKLRVATQGRSAYEVPLPTANLLTLTFPTGGNNLLIGSQVPVTWQSLGTVPSVRVDYSTNNGASWITVVDGVPNTGIYEWTIPATPTTQGRVRIADSSNVALFDQSDSAFSIGSSPNVIKYEERFESGNPPAGWLVVNNDGSAGLTYWDYRPVVAFQSGDTIHPHEGQRFWFSDFNNANGNGVIDEWLISPKIAGIVAYDSVYFWAGAIGGTNHDSLRVFISTTDNSLPSFTHQVGYFKVDGPVVSWHPYGFNLTPFAGSDIFVAVNYFIVNGGSSGNHSDAVWLDHFIVRGPNVTDVEYPTVSMPQTFAFEQNYPNPFNPSTTIRYSLASASDVEVTVYNILGQKVRTLVHERQEAGYYKIVWNGRNDQGISVGSGVYITRLKAGAFTQSRRTTLMK